MSKGPGRVEQAIESTLKADGDEAYDLAGLARAVWGLDPRAVEKKHKVSLKRALLNVIARMPDWQVKPPGRGGRLAVFNARSELSYARASATAIGCRFRKEREETVASGRRPKWNRDWRLLRARLDGDVETIGQIEGALAEEHEQAMAAMRPKPFPMPPWDLTGSATPGEVFDRHYDIANRNGFSFRFDRYMETAILALTDGDEQFRFEIIALLSLARARGAAHIGAALDDLGQMARDRTEVEERLECEKQATASDRHSGRCL